MKFTKLSSVALGAVVLAACGGVDGTETDLGTSAESIIRPTQTGGRNEVVMLYVITGDGSTRVCSGGYFAPRVVLTAAHCLENARQVFAYYGDNNYTADLGQLTQNADGFTLSPPPPGSPSKWALADSVEQHPQWDPELIYPDLGVVYLDRKLPFDPLPLYRNRLGNSFVNQQVTISGWGYNVATGPVSGTGGGQQRTGISRFLGSPTAADYHADDPNPGMLNPTVRNNTAKIDGRAPWSNGCFGDSGSPLLVTVSGQTYIAGVEYFGGLYCEEYSLYTRLEPFLSFFDYAYKKGGQETLIPNLECVAPRAGGYTAYFSYNNKNGVGITVPYGTKNQLALDTTNQRPTLFRPGDRDFAFGVNFSTNQTVSWTLKPDNSPTTTVTANKNSVACTAPQVECINACKNTRLSGCPVVPSLDSCMDFCTEFGDSAASVGCSSAYTTFNQCVTATAPGPDQWFCGDGYPYEAIDCQDELNDLFVCFEGG
jgi:hypothetical protein